MPEQLDQIHKLSSSFDKLPDGTHVLPVPISPEGAYLVNFPLASKKLGELVLHREGETITISPGGYQEKMQFSVAQRGPDGTIAGANEVFVAPVSNATLWRSEDGASWEIDTKQNGIADPDSFSKASDVILYHATKPQAPQK